MTVKVMKSVFEGLERVRESGATNMLDVNTVQRLAHENEDYATVLWLEDNKDQYARGVFEGIEPEE